MSENFSEELAEKPEENSETIELKNYYHIVFIGEIFIRIMTGFTILETLSEKPLSFRHLTGLYISYFLFKMILNVIYMFTFLPRDQKYIKTFLYEFIYYLAAFIFTIGAHSVARGRMEAKFLPIMLIPLILASFVKLAIGWFDEISYIQYPFYHFLESIQILLIVLKFVYPEQMGSWSLIIMFWLFLSLALLIVAALGSIAFVLGFLGSLIGLEFVTKNGRGFVVMGITLPLISKIIVNFLLLISFWFLVTEDLIGIHPDSELPSPIVRRTAIIMIVFNCLTLLTWFVFQNFFGVVPYDYYDYCVKDDLTKKSINWRFTREQEPK